MRRAIWIWTLVLISLVPRLAQAEVTRVEITSRTDIMNGTTYGTAGAYEQLVGRAYYAVDPSNLRNLIITDLDRAPKNAAGKVEMVGDIKILKPKDPSKGSGAVLIDVVNRGTDTTNSSLNRATEGNMGDGFLMRLGYTVVLVGWEFDVAPRNDRFRLEVPVAEGTTATVRAATTPTARNATAQFNDVTSYRAVDPASPQNTLTVRDGALGIPTTIPRDRWTLSGTTVTLQGDFEPGRTYELSYVAANAPIAGLGFAAVRDVTSWIKYSPNALVSAKHAMAFGSSQSGRFLRNFLYLGFNGDENDRPVFDGVIAHIAGASRIDLNFRGATPTAQGQFGATSFPFADAGQRDPVTGIQEGMLENRRAGDFKPKIFYTNTGVEYWGGGRQAALIHTSPDGVRDLVLPSYERVYFLAGSQHGPGRFPPAAARNGEQQENPNAYWYTMRALFVAMDKWMREGTVPPPSQYPKLENGTLVQHSDIAFPNIPGMTSPRALPAAVRVANPLLPQNGAPGTPMPFLVPQTDKDGIELAGIRLPDIEVPLATYTGWNFRNSSIGGASQLFPLTGAYIPFPKTQAQRLETKDPRASIAERYTSRDAYLELVRKAGMKLVADRYLLQEDLETLTRRASDHWDLLR
jgi:hypothetical protein